MLDLLPHEWQVLTMIDGDARSARDRRRARRDEFEIAKIAYGLRRRASSAFARRAERRRSSTATAPRRAWRRRVRSRAPGAMAMPPKSCAGRCRRIHSRPASISTLRSPRRGSVTTRGARELGALPSARARRCGGAARARDAIAMRSTSCTVCSEDEVDG